MILTNSQFFESGTRFNFLFFSQGSIYSFLLETIWRQLSTLLRNPMSHTHKENKWMITSFMSCNSLFTKKMVNIASGCGVIATPWVKRMGKGKYNSALYVFSRFDSVNVSTSPNPLQSFLPQLKLWPHHEIWEKPNEVGCLLCFQFLGFSQIWQ